MLQSPVAVISKDKAQPLTEREQIIRLREEVARARADAADVHIESERVADQMKQANEQLVLATVRADELAERALLGERAKDEFMAMLGHELRNPLAPIMTAVDLMDLRDPDACILERAIIKRQVRHMVRLVDDLLDISRITDGKVELHCEPIELSDLVARAIEMVSPLLEAKAHELVVRVPEEGLVVEADPDRMAQVAANLLTNAAKYTPDGGRIVVTGSHQGTDVVLSVKDSGVGIAKDMLSRVFDRFAQERQSLARSQGGLGLGLAIAKSLVALHHGEVSARSEGRGTGSEFIVALPAFSTPLSPIAVAARHTAADSVLYKILVVDDSQDTADLMAFALSQLGHDVRAAYDGPSALRAIADFAPDVAVLDIGLPGMNGYELAQELRSRSATIRLVAVTGYGQTRDRKRSRDAGFAKHLVKPVNFASVLDAIRSITPAEGERLRS